MLTSENTKRSNACKTDCEQVLLYISNTHMYTHDQQLQLLGPDSCPKQFFLNLLLILEQV